MFSPSVLKLFIIAFQYFHLYKNNQINKNKTFCSLWYFICVPIAWLKALVIHNEIKTLNWLKNGYPLKIINKCIKTFLDKISIKKDIVTTVPKEGN